MSGRSTWLALLALLVAPLLWAPRVGAQESATAPPVPAPPAPSPPTAAGNAANSGSPTNVEPISVKAKRPAKNPAYAADDSTTASKLGAPIKDVPQSVEVVTRQAIEDQGGTQRIDSLLNTVSGVQPHGASNSGMNQPMAIVRGFGGYGNGYLRDGYLRGLSMYTTVDAAGIERIEVLKGPDSALYGANGSLGGGINLISKRPTAVPLAEIALTAGSYNFFRSTADVGGAVSADGRILYRLNLAGEDGASFRDFIHHSTVFAAPAVSWAPTADDLVTVLVDYTRTRMIPDLGVPISDTNGASSAALAARAEALPRSLNTGGPGFDMNRTAAANAAVLYQHRFAPDWRLEAAYSAGHANWAMNYSYQSWNPDDPALIDRVPNYEKLIADEQLVEARLIGKVRTGPIEQALVVGLNGGFQGWSFGGNAGTMPSLDVNDPQYDAGVTAVVPGGTFAVRQWNASAYAQDLAALTPKLKVLVGARFDAIRMSTQNTLAAASGVDNPSMDDSFGWVHVSPSAGVLFQPTTWGTLYAGASTWFQPSNARRRDNTILAPESGVQYEVGSKLALPRGIAATLAAYQITHRNLAVCDPTDPSCTYFILLGAERSRGVELDVRGSVTRSLRLSAAYALMKAQITEASDPSTPPGTELIGAPRNAVNVFAVYTFPGALQRLELGGGVRYASPTHAVYTADDVTLPTIVSLDAYAAYRFDQTFRVQVNANNLLDRMNWVSNGSAIFPGEPRSVFATLTVRR